MHVQLLQGENKGNSFMPGQLNQDSIMLCLLVVFFLPCIQREGTLKVHIKFSRGKGRDLVSWNSTISGYAQHGYGRKALEIFEEMQKHNLKIDGVTFIGVISASTHTGLVDEGQRYLNIMVKDHHIEPRMEHYSCMVDLHRRAGMLGKAMENHKWDAISSKCKRVATLLAASRVHRNLELGKLAADKLISLQPQNPASYVLPSYMCALRLGTGKKELK
jgi:pentatricopeptide repeat protein